LLLTVYGLGSSQEITAGRRLISGTVTDDSGPATMAAMRIQGATKYAATGGE
jgi:hypothetical protein